MLQIIKDLPSHVVGIHAFGKVKDEEMEQVLMPLICELDKREEKINYLLVLETGVPDFTWGAWLKDMKLGFNHFKEWKKIAIVTDQKGMMWANGIFRTFIHGNSKGFPLNKLDEAVQWISKK